MNRTWVFGYGSLVSRASTAVTIDREVRPDAGYLTAILHGYGRRWNYGSLRQRADWNGPHGPVAGGVVVSLGVAVSSGEVANGAMIEVAADELARLDRRESDYDRVDVTDLVVADEAVAGRIVTYVPRPSAIARYEAARTDHRGAVRLGYVEMVEGAFAELGDGHLDRYRATTPSPDVPVLEFDDVWLEPD